MSEIDACQRLHAVASLWSDRLRPAFLPEVPVKCLPRPTYEGDNPYNGFTGAERRRRNQVALVLRRRGFIPKPEKCSLCGSTKRVGYHGEDYFDPWSMAPLCTPCHLTLHRRFRAPDGWLTLLDRNNAGPHIDEFRALPMAEVDLAGWLRRTTAGPYDPVEIIWPGRTIPDWTPRRPGGGVSANKIMQAWTEVAPSETDWRTLQTLYENPGATAAALSQALGWAGATAWQLHFGAFCRKLEPYLGEAPRASSRKGKDGEPAKFYIGLLAEYDAGTSGFTLKPAARHAFEAR